MVAVLHEECHCHLYCCCLSLRGDHCYWRCEWSCSLLSGALLDLRASWWTLALVAELAGGDLPTVQLLWSSQFCPDKDNSTWCWVGHSPFLTSNLGAISKICSLLCSHQRAARALAWSCGMLARALAWHPCALLEWALTACGETRQNSHPI